MNYKGCNIEPFGNGYTVFYAGDELYYDTVKEAKELIDRLEEVSKMLGVITVEQFDKAVDVFGFDSSVVTALWNTMSTNEDNQEEFETVYHKWCTGQYK